jgi:AraC-like DNA-binding protein
MITLDRAAGFSSERSRTLWWYVHNGAHWKCDARYGCKRTSYPGFQFMFMVAGAGTGGYLNKPWSAKKGDTVLMDLRQPHWYWADPRDPWEMYWLRFDGPGIAAIVDQLLDEAGSPVIPFASEKRVRRDFAALFSVMKRRPPAYDAWVCHYLSALLANVMEGLKQHATAEPVALDNAPAGIAAALEILRSQHARTISLQELAHAARMSLFHFTRRFKATTGFTPMEYLEKYRISRAQDLVLSRTQMRLKEVAHAVGYSDPAYFSRIFRKSTGISPREYRRTMGLSLGQH